MGKKLGAALILLLLAAAAAADEPPISYGGFGALTAGIRCLDIADADHYLAHAGDKLTNVMPSLGGHGLALLAERYVVGLRGDAAFFTARGMTMDAKFLDVAGGAEFGYAVANGGYGFAYPFVGVGASWTSLQLQTNDRVALARDYPAGSQAHNFAPAASVGFSYFYPVRFPAEDDRRRFLAYLGGVTAGATFNAVNRAWRDGGGRAIDGLGPADAVTFFLHVEVGFGGGATGL